ncbi:MAG TPA: MliC family protein [Paraburkholderia sp.]|jgi:membrane-bound inhibitor of C-type lysozyme|nr:MliC family protein [Paraburkholderia sp.]
MNERRLADLSNVRNNVRKFRHFFATACAFAFALAGVGSSPACAADAPLTIRDLQMQSRHTYRYTCANGKTFRVTYLGATNGQSFALVPVSGRAMLLVATIAASGVRYQGDRYTWWTKGPRADLYDATAGDDAKPLIAGCATIMR